MWEINTTRIKCHKKEVILWQNYRFMGANSSYKAMYDIVEQAKDGTIIIPDDFTTCGTPDAVRSGLAVCAAMGSYDALPREFIMCRYMISGMGHYGNLHWMPLPKK